MNFTFTEYLKSRIEGPSVHEEAVMRLCNDKQLEQKWINGKVSKAVICTT